MLKSTWLEMQFSIIENHELPTTIVFHEILKNTRKCLWDILPWVWYAQHNTSKIYITQKWEVSMKTCETSIILSKTIDPIQQTQQNKPNTYLNITFFKSEQLKKKKKTRNQRLWTWNTLRKIESPYLFLKFEEEMMMKMVDFWEKHGEFVREMNGQDNEQPKWVREKLKSF